MIDQPKASRLADELLFAGRFAHESEDVAAKRRINRNSEAATELRRLHDVNLGLIELAEALNAALTEVCSANPNLEISCEHDERIKSASAKLKESKHD